MSSGEETIITFGVQIKYAVNVATTILKTLFSNWPMYYMHMIAIT